jgi:2-polyprenyl-6-methoxyphenol hydroxylase-like FAD-dependent oxidoreductase
VLLELRSDLNKIAVWMQRYFYAVALQGMMQGGEAVTVMGFLQLGASFRARFKYPYIVIHRIDLHNVMLNACRRDPLISLVPDATVSSFSDQGDRVTVTTEDGRSYACSLSNGS